LGYYRAPERGRTPILRVEDHLVRRRVPVCTKDEGAQEGRRDVEPEGSRGHQHGQELPNPLSLGNAERRWRPTSRQPGAKRSTHYQGTALVVRQGFSAANAV